MKIAVDEAGRATSSSASGFSTAISECITSMMTSWRFPAPKDADGNPATAAFDVTLSMVPT